MRPSRLVDTICQHIHARNQFANCSQGSCVGIPSLTVQLRVIVSHGSYPHEDGVVDGSQPSRPRQRKG